MRVQRIIVTGASSGIGKVICDALRRDGYHVIGISRSIQRVEEEGYHAFPCDIQKPEEIASWIDHTLKHIGPIHGLINAAGVGFIGSAEDTSLQEARDVFETNTFGVFNMCQAVIPLMRQQRNGIIINITSLAGRIGLPYRGVYAASKFAVEGFSESMSQELKQFGIRVVILEPGDFNTPINQHRKAAQHVHRENQMQHDAIARQIREEVQAAPHPHAVASAILRILKKPSPALRYQVGHFMQKISVLVKACLPSRWFEQLVMKRYRMRS